MSCQEPWPKCLGRGTGIRWSLRSLPTQAILWFCHTVLCHLPLDLEWEYTHGGEGGAQPALELSHVVCLWQLPLHLRVLCLAQYLKGAYKKDGEQLFTKSGNDRTRGNGFNLKEGRFRLNVRRKHRGCWGTRTVWTDNMYMPNPWRCSRPECPWQSDLIGGFPVHGRGAGTQQSLRFLPTQVILWFYNSIILF